LIKKSGLLGSDGADRRGPLIQRFGSALNGNVHFHITLFIDRVYAEHPDGSLRFHWVEAPPSVEFAQLTETLARRIGPLPATAGAVGT
jgi:hypothetical protein